MRYFLRDQTLDITCSVGELFTMHERGMAIYGMLPPTVTVLRELLPVRTATGALEAASRRTVAPVLGRAEVAGDRMTVRWAGYDELTIDGDFPA